MKDEASLDSAGPLTVIAFLAIVLAVATWIMVDAQGSWGQGSAQAAAEGTSEAH